MFLVLSLYQFSMAPLRWTVRYLLAQLAGLRNEGGPDLLTKNVVQAEEKRWREGRRKGHRTRALDIFTDIFTALGSGLLPRETRGSEGVRGPSAWASCCH